MRFFFGILFLAFLNFASFASHIVGGEMIYDDLGNGKYKITLKIYRDCNSSTPFDGTGMGTSPAYITVYDNANTLIGVFDIGAPLITKVPPAFNNPCILTPNTVCVEEGIYTDTLTLPSKTGGYTIVYQRCCRNANIVNLANSNSNTEGSTYFAKIPGPEDAVNNSSPRYTKFPPIYICNDVNFIFDHSAVDPDGDQLVYSLCAPYTGLDGCCPTIGLVNAPSSNSTCVSPPFTCPQAATLPPYSNVIFTPPYSGGYPMPSNPAFSIDPVSGQLSGTPTLVAQYVVGVCVQEYRNNKLLNTHFRDFEFTVLNCTVSLTSAIADQKQQCQGLKISFANQSINQFANPVYHWDFGVPNLSTDTSNLFSPTYMYPDTGTYTVSLIANPGRPCTDTLKKIVYVYPPLSINFLRPDKQCFKNNSFSFNVNGVYLPESTFRWDFTSSATPSTSILKNPSGISFNQGGLFFVKLNARQFACRDSFIDSVRVIGRPKAKINNLQSGLCDPALVGFSNGSISDLPLSYYWAFSNGNTSTVFEPSQIFTPAGIYGATLTVETKNTCKDTSIFAITNILVNPSPTASFIFTPHEASIFEPDITIKGSSTDNAIAMKFNFGDGSTSNSADNIHTYADYGNYKITQIVTNGYGCVDSTSDIVKILPEFRFWIPNSFTPDGNSLNDFFLPAAIGISQYDLEIFDRWGERIFISKKLEEGWNGSYKGVPCEQGIYVWKISFKNLVSDETETHLGNVTLIRNP